MHPIRRLPPELLFEVFQFTVEADECDRLNNSDLDGRWGACDSPLILSSVCSLWRQVVQTRSSLWSYFNASLSHFMQGFIKDTKSNPFTSRVQLWAQYSADRKLDIAIRDIGDTSDPDGVRAAVMLKKVYALIGGRARRLQLLFSGVGAVSQALSSNVTNNLPALQQLSLHMSESVLPGIAHVPLGSFRSSLGTLEVVQLRNIWWDQGLSLPRLETFDVYNPDWRISPHQFLSVIANCKATLRELPIEFEHKPIINHNRLQFIQFDALESLHTTCEWISLAGPVLSQYIFAPKLANLQLYGRGDVAVLSTFIRAVCPNLSSLHLGIPRLQGEEEEIDLLSILRAAKKIESFAVDSVVIPALFFDALSSLPTLLPPSQTICASSADPASASPAPSTPSIPEAADGILCPLLKFIAFKDVTFSSPESLLRMIESRTRRGLNGKDSIPRRLGIVEIQGGKDLGLEKWHEARIEELMKEEDIEDPVVEELRLEELPAAAAMKERS